MSDLTYSNNLITTAYDIDLNGGIDNQGKLKELYGADALSNALTLWLVSMKGEIVRNPQKGGYIIPYISKPMSERRGEEIRKVIQTGLDFDFQPQLIVESISVIPNYEQKYWEITIKAYSPDYKTDIEISNFIKNLV